MLNGLLADIGNLLRPSQFSPSESSAKKSGNSLIFAFAISNASIPYCQTLSHIFITGLLDSFDGCVSAG